MKLRHTSWWIFLSPTILMGMKVAHWRDFNKYGDSGALFSPLLMPGVLEHAHGDTECCLLPPVGTGSSFQGRRMGSVIGIDLGWALNIHQRVRREAGPFRNSTARVHHWNFHEDLLHFSVSVEMWKKPKNYALQDSRDGLSWPSVFVGCMCKLKFSELIFPSVIGELLKLSSLSFFSPLKRE